MPDLPGEPVGDGGRRRARLRSLGDVGRAGRPGGRRACPPRACSRSPTSARRRGVRGMVVITAGFAESRPTGRGSRIELCSSAAVAGMRLVGPNCLGILSNRPAGATPRSRRPCRRPGPSRSPRSPARSVSRSSSTRGARHRHLGVRLDRQQRRRLGQRPARATGRTTRPPPCRAVPRVVRQPAPVRAASPGASPRRKPVLAVKSGRAEAGARAAASHTAARSRPGRRRRRPVPPGRRDPHATP